MRLDEAAAAEMKERQIALKKHGSVARYGRGCRCATCRRANSRACRKYSDTLRMLKAFRAMKKKAA